MRKIFILLLTTICVVSTWASDFNSASQPASIDKDTIYIVVDQMPQFPGGQAEMYKYLRENMIYPTAAKENGIQGRVMCTFVVNTDGSLVDLQVIRSGGDPSLDEEAMRILQSMPQWIPGKKGGQVVRVKYTVPISFKL